MELEVVKILSALVLWILSLCFGLMVPFLIWKSRGARRSCSSAHATTENDVLIHDEGIAGSYDDVVLPGKWKKFKDRVKVCFSKIRRYDVISIINCFCGGLFLGICLLELLPESRQGVVRVLALAEINTPFPVTEFIIGSGLLLVMFIEHAVSDVCSRTSRNVDYDTMERRRSHEVRENEDCDFTEAARSPPSSRRNSDVTSSESVRTLVLIGMLSIHSIFEGLALGLELNVASLIQLLLAVSVHKSVLAFGLGLRLFESFSDKLSIALACAIIFCTASPLGCVIGIFLTPSAGPPEVTTPDPRYAESSLSSIPTTDAVSAVLECLATGTFLYVTFVEVIPSEFSHAAEGSHDVDPTSPTRHRRKIKVRKLIKLLILLFGFGAIVGLQFI